MADQRPMFNSRIAVVVRDDLEAWQKLNVTAFVVSGVAATAENIIGEDYVDGSGNSYLPMFRQPVWVYAADGDKIRTVYERAMRREVPVAIYTEELFTTNNDADNRAAVAAVEADALNLAGLAFHTDTKTVDKIVKGIKLHS